MEISYAVVGKPFTKVRIDGVKTRVAKKAHVIVDGKSVCKVENAFTKTVPGYKYVQPGEHEICKLCLDQMERLPDVRVLMGERMG